MNKFLLELIKFYLNKNPNKSTKDIHNEKNIEHYIEIIYKVLRTGSKWKHINSPLHYTTYHKKFIKWNKSNLFQNVFYIIIKLLKYKNILNNDFLKDLYIDSTMIKNIKYFIDNRDNLSDVAYNHVFLSQYDQIIDKDGINNMNFVGKQENLDEDINLVLNKIGFTEIIHKKDKLNKNKIDFNYYKTYYTEYVFNFVNTHFDKDFKAFNYKKYNNFTDFINN